MEKQQLEITGEELMTTAEATVAFEFISFCAPFVLVRRRADGVRGTLRFQHSPRFYYAFEPDEEKAE